MHRTGLEPVTTRFEAGYSIRLSYRCEGKSYKGYRLEQKKTN